MSEWLKDTEDDKKEKIKEMLPAVGIKPKEKKPKKAKKKKPTLSVSKSTSKVSVKLKVGDRWIQITSDKMRNIFFTLFEVSSRGTIPDIAKRLLPIMQQIVEATR